MLDLRKTPRIRTSHVVAGCRTGAHHDGGATAAGMVTGKDIKNGSITTKDVKNGSLQTQGLQGLRAQQARRTGWHLRARTGAHRRHRSHRGQRARTGTGRSQRLHAPAVGHGDQGWRGPQRAR